MMIMKVVISKLWMMGENHILLPERKELLFYLIQEHKHRVLKVTKGVRKSLVGWIVGPRWR